MMHRADVRASVDLLVFPAIKRTMVKSISHTFTLVFLGRGMCFQLYLSFLEYNALGAA